MRNSAACVSATGATWDAVCSSARNSCGSCVRGSDRFRITGTRSISSGLSASIARLRSCPRPAKALPNSFRFDARGDAGLVVERVEDLVDLDRLAGVAWRSGIVAPSSQPLLDVPLVSSTYFSPSAERGRTITVESIGQRLDRGLELQLARRSREPSAWRIGVISSTTPTRVPPRRTSLPLTS